MRPRTPTSHEIKIVADQIPDAKAEKNRVKAYHLHCDAFDCVSSMFNSRRDGIERVGGAWVSFEMSKIGGETYRLSFAASQSEPSEDMWDGQSDDNSGKRKWTEAPVLIEMQMDHTLSGALATFPVARLSPDKVEWAESGENGEVSWRKLDIFEENDQEPFDVLRDTIEFLQRNR